MIIQADPQETEKKKKKKGTTHSTRIAAVEGQRSQWKKRKIENLE